MLVNRRSPGAAILPSVEMRLNPERCANQKKRRCVHQIGELKERTELVLYFCTN